MCIASRAINLPCNKGDCVLQGEEKIADNVK